MEWLFLIIAGLFEVVWALSLKATQGFTRLGPSLFTLLTMGVSFYLLSLAVRVLPVGTAYAVWVGIGAVGAAVFGMVFLGEPRTAARLFGLGLIIAGVVVLRMAETG
ncbi:MAG: multidrug efflux SMR transporter [Deinococcota bacterium]|nr:multidrug efflux SMR transporter [Deinococcota bacterium]